MPSRIDRGERFDRIAETACRIIATEGVAAATMRRVAADVGIGLSSLRHLCPDQDQLFRRTLQWINQQAEARAEPYWSCSTPEDFLDRLLANHIPVDDDARLQARAWAALRLAVPADSISAKVIEHVERQELADVNRVFARLRHDAGTPLPEENRVRLASEVPAVSPQEMPPGELHVVALVAGLAALRAERVIPADAETVARWLRSLPGSLLDLRP